MTCDVEHENDIIGVVGTINEFDAYDKGKKI